MIYCDETEVTANSGQSQNTTQMPIQFEFSQVGPLYEDKKKKKKYKKTK